MKHLVTLVRKEKEGVNSSNLSRVLLYYF